MDSIANASESNVTAKPALQAVPGGCAESPLDALVRAVNDRTPPSDILLANLAEDVLARLQKALPESADYMTRAYEALKRAGSYAPDERMSAMLADIAHFFYLIGKPVVAVEPARAALDIAIAAGSKPLERRALNSVAIQSADMGNIPAAVEYHARAIELAQELGDQASEGPSWSNLGVAFLYGAQYRDAMAAFEHAIALAGKDPAKRRQRTAAYANIALCCLHLKDPTSGIRAAEASLAETDEPTSSPEFFARVLREAHCCRLLLQAGELERAEKHRAAANHYAALSQLPRAEIVASIVQGLYEVHTGMIDPGLTRLAGALERARTLRPMLHDALAALMEGHEIAGDPAKALVYLREMMDVVRQTQQENMTRHVQLHLRDLGQGSDDVLLHALNLDEASLRGSLAAQELFRSRVEVLERLAVNGELRDDPSGEHPYRVGRLASLLAAESGSDADTCFMIELAARLHDIGKLGIPDAIVTKPGKLTEAERDIMRRHAQIGAEFLARVGIPHLRIAEDIARYHHEWWDGSGYPGGISGAAIPLAAQVTAVADVFDSITHRRTYSAARSVDEALAEIDSLGGRQFDPRLVTLFLALIDRLRSEHRDLDAWLGEAAHASSFLKAHARIRNILRRNPLTETASERERFDLQR
jgi:putative two-component system response regulator